MKAALLIRKLEHFTRLSREDKEILNRAASLSPRPLRAREDLIREGDRPRHVNLILEGWACRYRVLEDGRRQITAILIPGDLCDARVFILRHMDHSIAALSPITVAEIPQDTIVAVTEAHPRVSRALAWDSLVGEAIQREWTTNLGQRAAVERMAHLFCELFVRLRAVGLTDGRSCEMPATQAELADATGLSAVHANRTLQELRARRLIVLKGKTLTIPDLEALQGAALFDEGYLHLGREGGEFDSDEP